MKRRNLPSAIQPTQGQKEQAQPPGHRTQRVAHHGQPRQQTGRGPKRSSQASARGVWGVVRRALVGAFGAVADPPGRDAAQRVANRGDQHRRPEHGRIRLTTRKTAGSEPSGSSVAEMKAMTKTATKPTCGSAKAASRSCTKWLSQASMTRDCAARPQGSRARVRPPRYTPASFFRQTSQPLNSAPSPCPTACSCADGRGDGPPLPPALQALCAGYGQRDGDLAQRSSGAASRPRAAPTTPANLAPSPCRLPAPTPP